MKRFLLFTAILAMIAVSVDARVSDEVKMRPAFLWSYIAGKTCNGNCCAYTVQTMLGGTCVGWSSYVSCTSGTSVFYKSGSGCWESTSPLPTDTLGVLAYGDIHTGEFVYTTVNGVERVEIPFYTDGDNLLVAKLIIDQYNNDTLLTGGQLE